MMRGDIPFPFFNAAKTPRTFFALRSLLRSLGCSVRSSPRFFYWMQALSLNLVSFPNSDGLGEKIFFYFLGAVQSAGSKLFFLLIIS